MLRYLTRRRSCLEVAPRSRVNLAGFACLINANFDLRREVFGEAVLGELNLSMVATARSVGGAHTPASPYLPSCCCLISQGVPTSFVGFACSLAQAIARRLTLCNV